MTEVERNWRQVPPTLRTFAFDGSNLADVLTWVNQFERGVGAGTGGTAWEASPEPADPSAGPGAVRIHSTAGNDFGAGCTFDWPVGWVCSSADGLSFGLPGDLTAMTAGYEEITP